MAHCVAPAPLGIDCPCPLPSPFSPKGKVAWRNQVLKEDKTITVTFYAQPYDISATGFYFSNAKTYKESITGIRNEYGDAVEEFEIQFINGLVLDSKLARAIPPTQANILSMLNAMATWTEDQKIRVIVAVYDGGADFDLDYDDPDALDIDLYSDMTLSDLAYQFVDEGLFGDIPPSIASYIDYKAIAHDLRHDYAETTICGDSFVYRMT